LASIVFTIATFHVVGKLDLTILVGDFGVVEVTENVLYAMFTFRRGYVHVPKEVAYMEDNVVSSSSYQVMDVNPIGMFWIVTNGRFWILNDNAFNNSQDICLNIGTIASMANIFVQCIMMKEEPNENFHNLKFSIPIAKSLFIDLCDFFDENDPSLPNVLVPISVKW
jgi:hypothetical protein